MNETLLVYLPFAWLVVTATVNAIFHVATPQDVDAWAERNPRVAALAAVFRKLGVEPISLVTAIMHFFAANPAMPKLGNASMGKLLPKHPDAGDPYRAPTCEDYTPKPPATLFGSLPWFAAFAFFLCGLASGLFACGLVAAVPAAEKLAACESDVAQKHPGIGLAQFVAESLAACGGDAGVLVADILDGILASSDPALAQYKPEASATRQDSAKLGALRTTVRHP